MVHNLLQDAQFLLLEGCGWVVSIVWRQYQAVKTSFVRHLSLWSVHFVIDVAHLEVVSPKGHWGIEWSKAWIPLMRQGSWRYAATLVRCSWNTWKHHSWLRPIWVGIPLQSLPFGGRHTLPKKIGGFEVDEMWFWGSKKFHVNPWLQHLPHHISSLNEKENQLNILVGYSKSIDEIKRKMEINWK